MLTEKLDTQLVRCALRMDIGLSDEQHDIVERFYGIDDAPRESIYEIARSMDWTVKQVEDVINGFNERAPRLA